MKTLKSYLCCEVSALCKSTFSVALTLVKRDPSRSCLSISVPSVASPEPSTQPCASDRRGLESHSPTHPPTRLQGSHPGDGVWGTDTG